MRCRKFLARQNHPGARPAQRLVRGGRHNLCVRHRRRMHPARHQPGKVRHIHQQQRAALVGNRAHAGKIEKARIRAPAADNHLRLFRQRDLLQQVVVNGFRILTHSIRHHAVQLAREIQLVPVRQMPAMRQIQSQNRVSGLQHRHIGRRVGLRARVRLHIGMLRAEDLLGAIPRQVLHHVGKLAAAVVAASRIPLGILIREYRPSRLQHGAADEVFRCDHLQPFVLAANLGIDGGGDLGIIHGKRLGHAIEHASIVSPRRPHARRGKRDDWPTSGDKIPLPHDTAARQNSGIVRTEPGGKEWHRGLRRLALRVSCPLPCACRSRSCCTGC